MRQSLEGWTPSSPPAVGRLSAHLGWVSFSRAWLGTGLESVTTKPPPSGGGSVHSASGSVHRAGIPVLDPGRLPPPGTAAIAAHGQRAGHDDVPGSAIEGQGSLTSHDQSSSPSGDLCPRLRGTTSQGGHD